MSGAEEVTITVSRSTVRAAISCLDALSVDEREPQRYRDNFVTAAIELRAALSGIAATDDGKPIGPETHGGGE